MTPEPTVFVVDDDEAVRGGLRRLVEAVGLNVETYGSAQQFLDSYHREQHGGLVLDIRMTGMGGLDLQAQLAKQGVQLPVIILTGPPSLATTANTIR